MTLNCFWKWTYKYEQKLGLSKQPKRPQKRERSKPCSFFLIFGKSVGLSCDMFRKKREGWLRRSAENTKWYHDQLGSEEYWVGVLIDSQHSLLSMPDW